MHSFDTAQTFAAPRRARAEWDTGSDGRCVRPMRLGGEGGWHGGARVGHRGAAPEGADVAPFRPA